VKKLLLILKNNEVSYARVIKKKCIDNAIATFPYRRNDDNGNPYARALRHRDHNLNRGINVDVMVLDSGDPEDYYFKKYNSVTKEFRSDGLTEEERLRKIDNVDIFFGLSEKFDIDYVHDNMGRVENLIDANYRNSIEIKVRAVMPLSEAELSAIESLIGKVSGADKELVIYTIAAHYSRVCIDPLPGADPVDKLPEERYQWRDVTIGWWKKLIGTSREKEALTEMARIYAWTGKEEETKRVYNDLLKRHDVSKKEKDSIKRRINMLGTGRELYDEAVILYGSGEYEKCIEKLDEYDVKSSGIVKEFLTFYSGELRGKCLIERARKMPDGVEKSFLVDTVKRLLYPERK